MKLEKRRLEEIRPYENNPRINDNAVPAVVESIRQCEYVNPIIIDEDGVILAGHTRYKALQQLGYTEADVIVAKGLTEEQKKKYRFLDNKTAEYASWDLRKLLDEIEGLDLGDLFVVGDETVDVEVPEVDNELKHTGAVEYDTEDFGDEQFRYTCPSCGFRFN